MMKCESADRYQAIHPPRCNAGNACDTCVAKWQEAQAVRIQRANASKG